jgi:hypothetical protein
MTEYEFRFPDSLRLPPLGPPAELHRQRVTGLIRQAAPDVKDNAAPNAVQKAAGTVCVLGAGPCNDLSLQDLLDQFETVHLVDLDAEVLKQGVQRQKLPPVVFAQQRVQLWGHQDLVGIDQALREGNADPLPQFDAAGLMEQARGFTWEDLPRPVDVIASTCLISQLISHVVETLGEAHPQFVTLVQTIRKRHIELMLDHLRPGGRGVLIFDFLSSGTLPELVRLSGDPLKKVLSAAIDRGNFFHGLNPQVIYHLFETEFPDQLNGFWLSPPWVWNAEARCYAVTAFVFEKKSRSTGDT